MVSAAEVEWFEPAAVAERDDSFGVEGEDHDRRVGHDVAEEVGVEVRRQPCHRVGQHAKLRLQKLPPRSDCTTGLKLRLKRIYKES